MRPRPFTTAQRRLTPGFATFTCNSNAAVTVVAGVSSHKIRVIRWGASANATTNVFWQTNSGAQISGTRYMTQFATAGGAESIQGHFQTNTGDSLQIVSSANTNGSVSGEVTYIAV